MVTRALRFQYLWVDAICIIQDDSADKSREIAMMGEIYKQADITIAAGSASGVTEGFLQDRPLEGTCQMPFFVSAKKTGKIWLREDRQTEIDDEPLEKRGWTFQEKLLSRRYLYFGRQDVVWKCRREDSLPFCTSHNLYKYDKWKTNQNTDSLVPFVGFGEETFLEGRLHEFRDSDWSSLVLEYSSRQFTCFEDRAPAISGIVSDIQRIWNDNYLAGIWQQDFIQQLAWCIMEPGSAGPYISPGWSWINARGQVSIPTHRDMSWGPMSVEAEVLDCAIDLADERNPLGAVISGRLKLRAMIAKAPRWDDIVPRWCDTCSMDIGPEGYYELDETSLLLRLGVMDDGYISISLIVNPAGENTFRRIGFMEYGNDDGDPFETAERREVVII